MNTYKKTIELLYSLNNLTEDNKDDKSHAKLRAFLTFLGNPENKMKFIHVTGTSGKGSVTAYCQSILTQSGLKTGLYQSPFVTTFVERIKIDNFFISKNECVKLINIFIKKLEEFMKNTKYGMLGFGELAFAMTLYHFAEKKCDYAVIEVGCGGLLDYTNVIPAPQVAIITTIGKDHLKTLGPTLIDVARHKSGIIKKGTHVITTVPETTYKKIFKQRCKNVSATFKELKPLPKEIKSTLTENVFEYENTRYTISLKGKHQHYNAILAIETAHFLGIPIKDIKEGLKKTRLAARFEVMQQKPLVILDSAHNEQKIKSTISTLKNYLTKNQKSKIWIIFSFTKGKNITPIIRLIAPEVDKFIMTRHNHTFRKAIHPNEVLTYIKKFNKHIETEYFLDPHEALKYVLANASPDDIILISGSLYMAGTVRTHWISEKDIIKNRSMFT